MGKKQILMSVFIILYLVLTLYILSDEDYIFIISILTGGLISSKHICFFIYIIGLLFAIPFRKCKGVKFWIFLYPVFVLLKWFLYEINVIEEVNLDYFWIITTWINSGYINLNQYIFYSLIFSFLLTSLICKYTKFNIDYIHYKKILLLLIVISLYCIVNLNFNKPEIAKLNAVYEVPNYKLYISSAMSKDTLILSIAKNPNMENPMRLLSWNNVGMDVYFFDRNSSHPFCCHSSKISSMGEFQYIEWGMGNYPDPMLVVDWYDNKLKVHDSRYRKIKCKFIRDN